MEIILIFNLIPWNSDAYLIAADYAEENGCLLPKSIRDKVLPLDIEMLLINHYDFDWGRSRGMNQQTYGFGKGNGTGLGIGKAFGCGFGWSRGFGDNQFELGYSTSYGSNPWGESSGWGFSDGDGEGAGRGSLQSDSLES